MKYFLLMMLFWASGPAFSNDFRICGGRVEGVLDVPDRFDLTGADRLPFAAHLSWRSLGADAGRLNHCGGAVIDQHWVLTARHCVGDKNWTYLGVDVPGLGTTVEADLAICPVDARPFPQDDVALLRLSAPLGGDVVGAVIGPKIEAFPVTGHIGRWPVRRGVPAAQMWVSPISVTSNARAPMLNGRMVYAHERVPCGGESGSMLIMEDGSLGGVLTAISAGSSGRPDCNDPGTRIFLTPLAGWRAWVADVIAACARDPEVCVRPE